ncbi:unnamed protein product [Angiostrongylus costaricensis]|uniref:G_PROTEIN_RECEP_F1_2 domain-containing protein n=1 Tax=Angiostrongylus costaricensis TaxID=334426 RepID=A0A158PJS5_ANGCS|nr:unnamed protein product [Angiostrongylus costaricensis]
MIATTEATINSSLIVDDTMEKLNYLKSIYSWLIPVMIVILTLCLNEGSDYLSTHRYRNEICRIRSYHNTLVTTLRVEFQLAILGNGLIVLSAPLLTSPVSPYLKLCISLAAADICVDAWLEMFRVSGMLTSDMHLFALAINQFFGTMWPLKYKVMVTTRRIRWIVFSLWIVPLLFVFSWFISGENDGLRHESCNMLFYNRFPFRITIFLIFIVPLLATLLIYGLILSKLLKAKAEFEMVTSERRTIARRSNVQSKLKLVWTTLLIVSTFSLSWGLCVLYFVLVCVDGCPFTYNVSLNFYLGLFLNSTVNCLVSFFSTSHD